MENILTYFDLAKANSYQKVYTCCTFFRFLLDLNTSHSLYPHLLYKSKRVDKPQLIIRLPNFSTECGIEKHGGQNF